jgi:hypothetical protein
MWRENKNTNTISMIGIFTANIFFEYLFTQEKLKYQLVPSSAAYFRLLPRKHSKNRLF